MPEEIYDPRERLEIFLNAIRTGDVEGLPDPQTREEMYLAAIASKSDLPDTTDASAGDVLSLDSDKNLIWSQPPAPTIPELYLHTLCMYVAGSASVSAWYIDQSSGATTIESFAAWLKNHGFDATTVVYPFIYNDKEPSVTNLIVGVYSTSGTSLVLRNVDTTAFTPNIRLFKGQTTRIL